MVSFSASGPANEAARFHQDRVPRLTRASVLRDSNNRAGIGEFAAIQSGAPSLGVELRPVDTRDAAEIERILAAYARSPNGGLIVTPSASVSVYRDAIITLAARYRLPAVYGFRYNVIDGGLISYGPQTSGGKRRLLWTTLIVL
jgi:putative tryptophan/tyrosine transport system substrate-binding protein